MSTEDKKPKPPYQPRPTGSGEHPAVKKMREKFESIAEHTFAEAEALNERIEQLNEKMSTHPPTPSEQDVDPDSEVTSSELRRAANQEAEKKHHE